MRLSSLDEKFSQVMSSTSNVDSVDLVNGNDQGFVSLDVSNHSLSARPPLPLPCSRAL